jgi:DNA-binding transcriptional LysR family regulator
VAPGRRLLYGARKLIHDFDRTLSVVVRETKSDGQLTVGYSSYGDLRFMADLKKMTFRDARSITIGFESASSDETVLHVQNREWDCGIVILPVGGPHLDIIPQFRLPLAAAMPKSHRLARRRALKLEELREEPLILGGKRRDRRLRDWLLDRFSEAGIKPKIVEEAVSPHEAQYFVTRGVGVALANSGAFRTSPEGVIVRLFAAEIMQTETAIVVRREAFPRTDNVR